MNVTINIPNHEAGCPYLTAAGGMGQCICGVRAAFNAWSGPGVDQALYGAFAAGWQARNQPVVGIGNFTMASGAQHHYGPYFTAAGGIPIPDEK